jgi:hypothetical protein
MELAKFVQDMLCRPDSSKVKSANGLHGWTEVSFNGLNARLWSWHDSLPGEIRWNRWASKSDPLHLSIASLQFVVMSRYLVARAHIFNSMMYHVIRISLNRPFLRVEDRDAQVSTTANISSDAFKICDISADTIVSILHRFKSQQSLKCVPIIFAHGAIMATDVVLATLPHSRTLEATRNTILPALDAALVELSYAWSIATDARQGLQRFLGQVQAGSSELSSIISPHSTSGTRSTNARVTTKCSRNLSPVAEVQDDKKSPINWSLNASGWNCQLDGYDGNDQWFPDPLALVNSESISWTGAQEPLMYDIDWNEVGKGFTDVYTLEDLNAHV